MRKERGREGGTEEGREGQRKGGREGQRKGGRQAGREGGTERVREGGRRCAANPKFCAHLQTHTYKHCSTLETRKNIQMCSHLAHLRSHILQHDYTA